MYRDFMPEMARVRRQEYEAEVKRRRLRKLARVSQRTARMSLRARTARRLFDAAFTLETDESWRAVWDRMSGPGEKSGERTRAEKKRLTR